VLILAIVLFGLVIGGLAQLILGRLGSSIDWSIAMAMGIIGSLIGGLLSSLLSGDGLALRFSGIIGSLIGAVIATALWRWWQGGRSDIIGHH
jgi:uncharacterized membrane protein YeaQ/YmgE (transglycosylase-associated protein family)